MINKKEPEEYQVEDFLVDESFVHYHFRTNSDHHAFWEQWIIQHPEKETIVKEAVEMLQMLSLRPPGHDYEFELGRIKTAIAPEHSTGDPKVVEMLPSTSYKGVRNYNKWRWALFIAAASVILLLSGYLLINRFKKTSNSLTILQNTGNAPLVFTLNDGTIVTLATNSSLRYPEKFMQKNREVLLDGDAEFHVRKDAEHPFKVHSGDLVATVLGTVFNIKRQSGDSVLFVELIEGKLKIDIDELTDAGIPSLVIYPNERVVYNTHTKNIYKQSWQRSDAHSLQKAHLVFKKNSFEEIAKQIKNVFGTTIINQSNDTNWRFTGEFTNATLDEIIEGICLVKGLHAQSSGDTILIR